MRTKGQETLKVGGQGSKIQKKASRPYNTEVYCTKDLQKRKIEGLWTVVYKGGGKSHITTTLVYTLPVANFLVPDCGIVNCGTGLSYRPASYMQPGMPIRQPNAESAISPSQGLRIYPQAEKNIKSSNCWSNINLFCQRIFSLKKKQYLMTRIFFLIFFLNHLL